MPTRSARIPALERAIDDGSFREDPHAWYRMLRETAPVYFSESLGQWLVTSYELVEELLLAPERFSSFGFDSSFIARLDAGSLATVPTLASHFQQRGLIQADPPEHTRIRRAVRPYFANQAVARLEVGIHETVRTLLDGLEADFEVVRDFASPLPVSVIASLLGVPEKDRGGFPTWTAEAVRFFGSSQPEAGNAINLDQSLVKWRALLGQILEQRLTEPREDFLSVVAGLVRDGALTREEALFTCVHLMMAGHETTTSLVTNTMFHLLTRPEVQAAVVADTELVSAAIEETLRFEPPIQRVRRAAVTEVELGGCRIEKGASVIAVLASANRDPSRFSDADTYDIHRSFATQPHVAFGRGVHFCLGAPLARLEAPIAVKALIESFPEARLPDSFQPDWIPTINLRRPKALPIQTGRGAVA